MLVSNVLDVATLERTFTILANEGLIDLVSPLLMATMTKAAPNVRIHFVSKYDKDAQPLREGMIDLEISVIGTKAPELKTRLLFQDRFVDICRTGHPLLNRLGVTAECYAGHPHVVVSRKRQCSGPVEDALDQLGLRSTVVMVVPTYANAMRIVCSSDLIGLVPRSCLGMEWPGDVATSAGILPP